jgi:RNA polymerase sigma factor for flagellar operon FliA
MLELARELGVTESRVSQMKAEALGLLREGLDATLETDSAGGLSGSGRVARRKAAYFAAVAAGSSYRDRLDSQPRPLQRETVLDERITA